MPIWPLFLATFFTGVLNLLRPFRWFGIAKQNENQICECQSGGIKPKNAPIFLKMAAVGSHRGNDEGKGENGKAKSELNAGHYGWAEVGGDQNHRLEER